MLQDLQRLGQEKEGPYLCIVFKEEQENNPLPEILTRAAAVVEGYFANY